MNEVEVERQVDQMVRFIKQEAEEKANEISVSAEEEFNIDKLQLIEAEKSKIKKDFERREGQIEVKKKIEYSKQLNESRIKVLQARENAVQTVIKEAHTVLISVSKDKKKYSALLTDLLVQALNKLLEPEVVVRVRKADLALVKDILAPASKKFTEVYGQPAPAIKIDETTFLPPAPTSADASEEVASCCGGMVVTSASGAIVCNNTLDDRLRIAYSQNLPAIRGILFGVDPPVRS